MEIETRRMRVSNQVSTACDSGIKSLEKFLDPAQRIVKSLRYIAGLRLAEHLDAAYADDMRRIAASLDWPAACEKAQKMATEISKFEESLRRSATGEKN